MEKICLLVVVLLIQCLHNIVEPGVVIEKMNDFIQRGGSSKFSVQEVKDRRGTFERVGSLENATVVHIANNIQTVRFNLIIKIITTVAIAELIADGRSVHTSF